MSGSCKELQIKGQVAKDESRERESKREREKGRERESRCKKERKFVCSLREQTINVFSHPLSLPEKRENEREKIGRRAGREKERKKKKRERANIFPFQNNFPGKEKMTFSIAVVIESYFLIH